MQPYHIRLLIAHRWTCCESDPTDYTPGDEPTAADREWAAANLNDDGPDPAVWLAWEREQELLGAAEADLGVC